MEKITTLENKAKRTNIDWWEADSLSEVDWSKYNKLLKEPGVEIDYKLKLSDLIPGNMMAYEHRTFEGSECIGLRDDCGAAPGSIPCSELAFKDIRDPKAKRRLNALHALNLLYLTIGLVGSGVGLTCAMNYFSK